MKIWKLLAAGVALGIVVVAFRDLENQRWLTPAGMGGGPDGDEVDDEEPVLGYDGMDQETLLDWLDSAGLDREALARMRRYEETHLAREVVLSALDDLL